MAAFPLSSFFSNCGGSGAIVGGGSSTADDTIAEDDESSDEDEIDDVAALGADKAGGTKYDEVDDEEKLGSSSDPPCCCCCCAAASSASLSSLSSPKCSISRILLKAIIDAEAAAVVTAEAVFPRGMSGACQIASAISSLHFWCWNLDVSEWCPGGSVIVSVLEG